MKFQGHSLTSKLAAMGYEPHVMKAREAVYRTIEVAGDDGATDEEIQHALDMNPSTERPRRIELYEDGIVSDSGRTRETTAEAAAVVWIVTGKLFQQERVVLKVPRKPSPNTIGVALADIRAAYEKAEEEPLESTERLLAWLDYQANGKSTRPGGKG